MKQAVAMNRSVARAGLTGPASRIVHLTSVHPRHDNRILHKQCVSLHDNGWDVTLVVADGKGHDIVSGVKIDDVGGPRNRLLRMLVTPWRVLARALELRAAAYHLHDPELLPVAMILKAMRKTVIFDSHEHYPRDMLSKPYLHPVLRQPVSKAYAFVERLLCSQVDAVVAANPWIKEHFEDFHPNVEHVDNYPRADEFLTSKDSGANVGGICYVGYLTVQRGVLQMVKAMEHVKADVRLTLAGEFEDKATEDQARAMAGWRRVDAVGYLDRKDVTPLLGRSRVGLVVLHPEPNFVELHSTKLFEYMGAGMPAVASDFPTWQNIVDEVGCGICVDPLDPIAIARAIDEIISNPQEAASMGKRGRDAVVEKYNWENEESKLLMLYERLVGLQFRTVG